MPVTLQGNWTVQLVSQPIDQPQRFIIAGATLGNGTYSDTYTAAIGVEGTNWTIRSQEEGSWSGSPGVWIDSNNVEQTPIEIINGNYVFYFKFDDYRGGVNYDDMIIKLSKPAPPPPPPDPLPDPLPDMPVPDPLPEPPPAPPAPPKELSYGRVYTKFEIDDKLPRQTFEKTYGIWTDYTGSVTGNLIDFYTCSLDSGSFKKTVYNSQCFTCSSSPQFDIAYGHDGGSGSKDLGGNDYYTPSNAVYGQYRSLCLNPGQQRFKIGNREIYHFYAINVKRDRMGDRLDAGNIEINLAELSGSYFQAGGGQRNAHTGSNVRLSGTTKTIRLIDDSKLNYEGLTRDSLSTVYCDVSESLTPLYTDGGAVHYIVSGNLETGIYSSSQPHVYGLIYPQQGIIILDAQTLDLSASFLTVTGSDVAGDNVMKLYTAMSGAALRTDDTGDRLGFQARKVKKEFTEQFFVRVKNQEYNFTNNPSYVTGSDQLIINDFYGNPAVYITQVGLYNEQKELLAVAKLSEPIYKSYTEEALIEVQLKY
jgi:hypothetical protein